MWEESFEWKSIKGTGHTLYEQASPIKGTGHTLYEQASPMKGTRHTLYEQASPKTFYGEDYSNNAKFVNMIRQMGLINSLDCSLYYIFK